MKLKKKKLFLILAIITSLLLTKSIEHFATFNLVLIIVIILKEECLTRHRLLYMLFPFLFALPEYISNKNILIQQFLLAMFIFEVIDILPKLTRLNFKTYVYYQQIFFWTLVFLSTLIYDKRIHIINVMHHFMLPLIYTIVSRNKKRSLEGFREGFVFITFYVVTLFFKQSISSKAFERPILKLKQLGEIDAIKIITGGNYDTLIQEIRLNIYNTFSKDYILDERRIHSLLPSINPNTVKKYIQLIDMKNTNYNKFKNIIKRNPTFYLNIIYTISNNLFKSIPYSFLKPLEESIGNYYNNIHIMGYTASSTYILFVLGIYAILSILKLVQDTFHRNPIPG